MKYISLVSLLLSFNIFGQVNTLKVGDIILQPLKCWSCELIEGEENSEFAHIGIVYSVEEESVFVAEAYGEVQILTLANFLKKSDPTRKSVVKRYRHRDFSDTEILAFQRKIKSWEGNPYDRMFLFNNRIDGKEALYCSELTYKALSEIVLFSDLAPSIMLFENNPEYWDRYFRGNTPRGEEGISPEDFNRSTDFMFVKNL